MKVSVLSLKLTRVNPLIDSSKTEEDGKLCRDIFIEGRSGVKILARIDETKVDTYRTDFNGFSSLEDEEREQLVSIIKEYSATPLEVRLTK